MVVVVAVVAGGTRAVACAAVLVVAHPARRTRLRLVVGALLMDVPLLEGTTDTAADRFRKLVSPAVLAVGCIATALVLTAEARACGCCCGLLEVLTLGKRGEAGMGCGADLEGATGGTGSS